MKSIKIKRLVLSNTDSGAKTRVQCKNTTSLYLAFIIRNLFLNGYKYRCTIKINIVCFRISQKIRVISCLIVITRVLKLNAIMNMCIISNKNKL